MALNVAIVTELGEWSASTRYRALQHIPRLRDRLGNVDVFLPDDRPRRRPGRVGQFRYFAAHGVRYFRRWAELQRVLPNYDTLFVQRGAYALGPGAVARPIERFPGRVVFDLDDAVFHPHPMLAARARPVRWLYGPGQAGRVLRCADAVIASSAALADEIRRFGEDAVVLPTVPDPARYSMTEHRAGDRVIGWAGTNGGLHFLDPLEGVFAELRDQGIGVLEVVSSEPWHGPSHFREWCLTEEQDMFRRFAVGIMPLPNTAYTRSKAGFKLLQYMAAGVPVVASPVGVNEELVIESRAGLLAESPSEWLAALEGLLLDVGRRRELGANGRSFVESYADMNSQADAIARLLAGP
jgi:glycosyltransferase involved in cell wall biosynthesis